MKSKPTITTTKNGPLILAGLEEITDLHGKILEVDSPVALCRCGASQNKPFCDGSHVETGFSDDLSQGKPGKVRSYVGDGITIHFNPRFCSHPGFCLLGSPSVFNLQKHPWIMPDNDTVDNIIKAIRTCPTGALSYSVDGVLYDSYSDTPSLTVVPDGPYDIKGSIELIDARQPASKEHYSLCRCGRSRNKPFCDGEHRKK